MPPEVFQATYAPTAGPLRLGQWRCTDERRLGPHASTFHATLAHGDTISTTTTTAGGPIGALTAILYDHGMGVELREFHQVRSGAATATFVWGSDGSSAKWAMAVDDDQTTSALRAMIACANRLYA